MQLAPAGVPLSFDVTFGQSGLAVAMSVYDLTTMSPTLVAGPTAMDNVVAGTYAGNFTGSGGRSYLIFKAVYTDGTFTTLDDGYSQGSETIVVQDLSGGGGGGGAAIIGEVLDIDVITGLVDC